MSKIKGAEQALLNYSKNEMNSENIPYSQKEELRRAEIDISLKTLRSNLKHIEDLFFRTKNIRLKIYDDIKALEDEKETMDQGQLILDDFNGF